MDSISTYNNNVINPELVRFHEGTTSDSKDIGEIGTSMEILTKVDLQLAYASEKLLNLENLLLYVLSWENDFEAMAADDVSDEFVNKSLEVDLLFSFLDSEVKELDGSMDCIRVDLVDARQKLSSCKHLGELFLIVEGKLHDSEESSNKSQEHVLEMKIKLAKLQMTSLAFNHNQFVSEEYQISSMQVKPRLQTMNKVHVLRMLERSLLRELDLEKKLTESKYDEEDLRLKLRLTEQVAFIMEEAAEVVWGRFLEAENAAVVLLGVSRDLVSQHQIVQFNLNSFDQRENAYRLKLENCIKLLNSKDTSIEKLNTRITQLVADNLELSSLRDTVKSLEEKVNESESNLKKANESNELLQDRVGELENRAETAEEKVVQLTDSNIELTDELTFLKGSHESSSKKMSLLEKQSRELEIQFQQAKASSQAGHEQQNMLYSAIWDMETLIDELKQKVSIAEIKAENDEQQCLLLTDTNSELTKEVDFLRAEVESLETSLSQANLEKIVSTKDISNKTKLIMDTVMQLAIERERITKQLQTQTEEKRLLMETLQKLNKDAYTNMYTKEGFQENKVIFASQEIKNATLNLTKPTSEFIKEEEEGEIQVLNDNSIQDPELESSVTDSDRSLDETEVEEPEYRSKKIMLVFRTIFVLMISVFAVLFINGKPERSDVNEG